MMWFDVVCVATGNSEFEMKNHSTFGGQVGMMCVVSRVIAARSRNNLF